MTRWQRVVLNKSERFANLGFRQDADDLRALLPPRVRKVKPSKDEKRIRREDRNAKMVRIRYKVMERARGHCEVCATGDAAEAHHLISGGLRRARESVDTMVAVCRDCHRAIHRGEVNVLESARLYAESCGMHEAVASLARRIDKIHEARVREIAG